jgi:beta-lactamase class A
MALSRRDFLMIGAGALFGYLSPHNLIAKPKEVKSIQASATKSTSYLSPLEETIADEIKNQRSRNMIAQDEKVGIYVYDLTSDERLVNINGEERFQAASMVKPLVALAYYHEVRNGSIVETSNDKKKVKAQLRKMLVKSNNHATNWFMKKIGGPDRVNDILNKHYSTIFKNTLVVEYIPGGGQTYKNKVAPHDYSRFLYALIQDDSPVSGRKGTSNNHGAQP